MDPNREKRWAWWGQIRDTAAAIAGFALLGVETSRGTYNPIAMGMVVALLGITVTGTVGRFLLGRYANGEKR